MDGTTSFKRAIMYAAAVSLAYTFNTYVLHDTWNVDYFVLQNIWAAVAIFVTLDAYIICNDMNILQVKLDALQEKYNVLQRVHLLKEREILLCKDAAAEQTSIIMNMQKTLLECKNEFFVLNARCTRSTGVHSSSSSVSSTSISKSAMTSSKSNSKSPSLFANTPQSITPDYSMEASMKPPQLGIEENCYKLKQKPSDLSCSTTHVDQGAHLKVMKANSFHGFHSEKDDKDVHMPTFRDDSFCYMYDKMSGVMRFEICLKNADAISEV